MVSRRINRGHGVVMVAGRDLSVCGQNGRFVQCADGTGVKPKAPVGHKPTPAGWCFGFLWLAEILWDVPDCHKVLRSEWRGASPRACAGPTLGRLCGIFPTFTFGHVANAAFALVHLGPSHRGGRSRWLKVTNPEPSFRCSLEQQESPGMRWMAELHVARP